MNPSGPPMRLVHPMGETDAVWRAGAPGARVGAVTAPAFEDAYAELWRPMLRLAASLVDDPALAEDVAQEAFARTLLRWAQLDDPVLYLRRAVVNRSRSELRRRVVRRRAVRATVAAPPGEPVVDDAVLRALRSLSPKRRAVVALRFYEDLTEPQIARVLGVRLGTVKSTLHTALAQLRKELEP